MVLTHLGPPSCRRQTSARYARPQVPFGSLRRRQRHSPRFMTKSPISCDTATGGPIITDRRQVPTTVP
jgi:hypothetical protein